MSHRHLLVLALTAGISSTAAAQFTTFIPPQSKLTDSVKTAVVAQQKAQGDSVARVQLTNMKTWVDSAAGVVAPPMTVADSLAQPTLQDTAAKTVVATDSAPTLRNGARAPATASPLPLMALIGVVTLAIGTVML